MVGNVESFADQFALQIEETHPLKKVQQQAYNLRFILQAPKLKRGPDEVVKIPVLQIEERKKCVSCQTYAMQYCSMTLHLQGDVQAC